MADAEYLARIIAAQTEIATAAPDLLAVMHLTARRAQELTPATGAAVELLEGAEMVYHAATGSASGSVGLRLGIASLSGLCVQTGEILQCDDAESDPRVDRAACRRAGVRSMLVVPLHFEGRAVGVLKVLSTSSKAFSPRDIHTLQLLAAPIGAAMGRAAAFQALQEANAALRAEITERQRAEQALQEALQRVHQLQGVLPICGYCKSVRDDQDYWHELESYLSRYSDVRFSHGVCPQCVASVVSPQVAELRAYRAAFGAAQDQSGPAHRKGTVLVVEDQSELRDTLAEILEIEGYAVLTAADGQAALTAARSQPPDLILLDLLMPVMNG